MRGLTAAGGGGQVMRGLTAAGGVNMISCIY